MVTSESSTPCRLRANPISEVDEQAPNPVACCGISYPFVEGRVSMLAVSVRRNRLFATAAVAAALYTVVVVGPVVSADNEQIPNFSPYSVTVWFETPREQ